MKEVTQKKFRVHHILCTVLYQGKGYSGAFCENMTARVMDLRENPKQPLCLVTEPDMICVNCPNLTKDNTCTDDKNHVQTKDKKLLETLGLVEGGIYTYRELLSCAKQKITEDVFLESCQNCRWYQQGLCSYAELEKGFQL